ncbi:hypothetical protein [Salinivibrio kushneri]|uniref:hypothetical protein n=1 Tax=Salinivibrio kushneri TaxID=1908198 RepID=UPI0022B4573F|nr:hypothetical protein [Salinivibrio kushneri]WBA11812.1 hypothetical protein O4546_00810 [Salinivibrio kushneri]
MKHEKVAMKPLMLQNPFLKTPDEVANLFGLPLSARRKVKLIEFYLQEEVKLSDRSLDNLGSKGISKQKADKAIEPILDSFERRFDLDLDQLIPDGTLIFELDVLWQAAIKAFFCGLNSGELEVDTNCFQPFVAFIERRCREYLPQKEVILQLREREGLDPGSHLVEFYEPVIGKAHLRSCHQDVAIKALNQFSQDRSYSPTIEELEALSALHQDFNLSLFASLDLVALNLLWAGYNDEQRSEDSVLVEILAEDAKCYFGRLIAFIKRKVGCSFAKISELVPVQFDSSESGRTEKEVKIERLKEWRKGKTKPSVSTMDEFFSHFDLDDQIPLLIYGLICQAIDREISKYRCADERALLQQTYSPENYRRYYEKEKAAASLSTATTTTEATF